MSTVLARLYDFAPNAYVRAAEVNAELNQIIGLLAGTTTNKRGYSVFSDATLPVWDFNQLSAGDIVQFKKSNVIKVYVNSTGQICSNVAAGTAPIKVASTTLVANLNADKIDGVDSSALVRNDTSGQFLTGNLRIKKLSTGTHDIVFELDNNILTAYSLKISDNTVSSLFTISDLDQATRVVNFPSTTKLQSQYTPSASNDVVRKTDFDSRVDTLSLTFFSATPNTGLYIGGYICPSSNSGIKLKKLKASYHSGAPAGTSIYKLYKNGSDTGNQITLTAATAIDTVVSVTLGTEIVLAENDIIHIVVNGDQGHNDISIAVTGSQ